MPPMTPLPALDGLTPVGTDITLVAAGEAGRERVYALRRRAYHDLVLRQFGRWDDADLRARFDAKWRPDAAFFVRRGDGDLGALEVDVHPGALFVRSIALVPEAQGGRVGTAVMHALRDVAHAHGLDVTLSVVHANARAAALYLRLGFTVDKSDDARTWMCWTRASR